MTDPQRRRACTLAALSLIASGCGYPDFAFVGDATVASTDTADDVGGDDSVVDRDGEPHGEVGGDGGAETTGDGSVDASSEDGAIDAADAACALPVAPVKTACASLQRLKVAQIMDAKSTEFCAIDGTPFDATTAGGWSPSPLPAIASSETVMVRAAWSSMGLHVHVHVDDPSVQVVPAGRTDLYDGDSVELFVSAVAPTTGAYSTDHALQVDISPPTISVPARAQAFVSGTSAGPYDATRWAARAVTGGWEAEAYIPWSALGGAAPLAGSTIGFDVAINIDYDATKDGHLAWLAMDKRDVPTSPTCGGGAGRPSCDTRTFCAPTLLP